MQKGVPFFQASWAVPPFLASLEQKRNTFCESWNFEYNQNTYHILQLTAYYTIASKFNRFRNNYYLDLLWKLRNYQKMCSSNCSNLQARMNFLKNSKPAGNWWGTPFLGNSSWGALHACFVAPNNSKVVIVVIVCFTYL